MIMHLPVHVVHTVMEESFIFSYYFDSSHKQFLYYISILCDYCHLSQEFQEDNRNLVISEPETSQTVYIYKCNKSTIQVKGKINSMVVG